jgi:cellulose biosynthesis protein BcsQ
MYADQGKKVVAVDLDPQANLTTAFLDEDELEKLWPESAVRKTVFGSIEPLLEGTGDIAPPHVEPVADGIGLLVGDVYLADLEDDLSLQWPLAGDGKERALRLTAAFWRVVSRAAADQGSDLVLLDLGPNLGAINRAALVAADHVLIPISPDLPTLQSLHGLGSALRTWRDEWADRRSGWSDPALELPAGSMRPLGYVVFQQAPRYDRPTRASSRWRERVPAAYAASILGEPSPAMQRIEEDPNCLGRLRHYHSLMPMSLEARKPVFHLTTADGAIGALQQAVLRAYDDFERLARRVEERLRPPRAQPSGS